MDKNNLAKRVDEVLAVWKINRPGGHFTTQEIATEIEAETSEKLHDDALRDIQKILQGRRDIQKPMRLTSGPGVERDAVGNQLWKFGSSRVSHPIRPR